MLFEIAGLVLLDSEGTRLAARYWTECPELNGKVKDHSAQIALEQQIHKKAVKLSSRADVEVMTVDDLTVLTRTANDVSINLIATPDANVVMLHDVTVAVYQALVSACGVVNKKNIWDNLGSVFITFDEVVENGILFETNAATIASRVFMNENNQSQVDPVPSTFNQALASAKDNLFRSFLTGS